MRVMSSVCWRPRPSTNKTPRPCLANWHGAPGIEAVPEKSYKMAGLSGHTPMSLSSTKEIIAELRAGRMVILVDEEDSENEGDLVLAAEFVTPEAINFMARFGRGQI